MIPSKIKSITYINDAPKYVYNIGVSHNHNYFANSILVHNCDDPNNYVDVFSKLVRDRTNDWWHSSISLRATNINTTVYFIIMQRLHEEDLTGSILSDPKHDYIHLRLPARFEENYKCVTVPLRDTGDQRWEDPRTIEREELWPERWGKDGLANAEKALKSSTAIASQLQQRPTPEDGGIIQIDWFQVWQQPLPKFEFIIQSWDCAFMRDPGESKKADPSYSACTTWGVFEQNGINHVMLVDLWQGMVEFYELRQKAKELHDEFSPTEVLVEAKASGISLITELRRAGISATRFDPSKYSSKIARARMAVCIIEAERVWVPAEAPSYKVLTDFADVFLDACASFPFGKSNDIVDSMSQAIIKLNNGQWLYHPDDENPIYLPDYYVKKAIYE